MRSKAALGPPAAVQPSSRCELFAGNTARCNARSPRCPRPTKSPSASGSRRKGRAGRAGRAWAAAHRAPRPTGRSFGPSGFGRVRPAGLPFAAGWGPLGAKRRAGLGRALLCRSARCAPLCFTVQTGLAAWPGPGLGPCVLLAGSEEVFHVKPSTPLLRVAPRHPSPPPCHVR